MVDQSYVPARRNVLMFSVACAAIMHCYSDQCGLHRDVFKSKYLNVLDFIFGGLGAGRGMLWYIAGVCCPVPLLFELVFVCFGVESCSVSLFLCFQEKA